MNTMKAIKTTVAPEDWGNYSFPEGMSSLQDIYYRPDIQPMKRIETAINNYIIN